MTLNYRDPRPIYEQLIDMLRKMILTGAIPTGERLPSVRELAAELAVNPNTIQRAYRELEAQGFVVSVGGKGSFAAPLTDVGEKHKKELWDRLTAAAAELRQLGESKEVILQKMKEVLPDD